MQSFNPHFRKGSDLRKQQAFPICPGFNPHFRKGSDITWSSMIGFHLSFNPHFRKGSDPVSVFLRFGRIVSIHTSAREVTIEDGDVRMVSLFQSTLPQGKWQRRSRMALNRMNVSIHTSAREVTRRPGRLGGRFQFQSTLPQGKWL